MQTWMHELQSLPQASRGLKNALEKEWEFSKEICPHVRGGEAEAGRRFWSVPSQVPSYSITLPNMSDYSRGVNFMKGYYCIPY